MVAFMKKNSTIKVEFSGHTDNQGGVSSNQVLSENRAKAVRDYLINAGIEADRMTAVGFGQERPIADNNTEAGRARNRRTEYKIVGK